MHQTNREKPTMKLGGETETQSHHKPHPSTLTPPCPRLPGSPRTACTLTPPCPRLPGSPRIACTLGLAQQSQKLLLTRHLLVAWLWWPLGLARKCPTGMLPSVILGLFPLLRDSSLKEVKLSLFTDDMILKRKP